MVAVVGIVLSIVMLLVVFGLLLTRRLREKYAVLWIIIGVAMLVLGVFPQLLLWLTSALGVVLPANLLFAMAILLLLGVALHLSWELSQAEDEIRRAAEELAILRATQDDVKTRMSHLESRLGGLGTQHPDA